MIKPIARNCAFTPSPGTPGEGWGEGLSSIRRKMHYFMMHRAGGLLALILSGALVGCNNNGSSSGPAAAPNAPKPVAAPTASPSATASTKLKSGPAPLTYVVGPGGAVRIMDTAITKPVVQVTAAPNAVIMIDQAKGISISNTVVKAGPLPAGHQYEIWLDH